MLFEISVGIILFIIIIFIIIVIILYETGRLVTNGATGATGARGPPGETKSYISFNSVVPFINNNFQLYGKQSTVENASTIVISDPGSISNLLISNTNAVTLPGGDIGTRTYTIRKNGISTPLTVTLTQQGRSGSSNVNIDVLPGDLISLLYTETGDNNFQTNGNMTFTLNLE